MMYGWGGGWPWWAWLAIGASFVVFWSIVVVGVLAVVRWLRHSYERTAPPLSTDAEAILRERLARGDIDEEEYRKRIAVLREHS